MTEADAPVRAERIWRPVRPSVTVIVGALIVALIVAGGAAAFVLRETPIYQSTRVLLIDQPSLIVRATNEGPILKLNQLRAKYGVLARTEPFTVPVAERLGITPGQVANSILISLPGPSLVMLVVARAGTPVLARDIADEMGEQLISFLAAEQEAAGIPNEDRIVLRTVAAARPGTKLEPTRGRAIVTGTVAGILALLSVLLIHQILARRRLAS